MLQANKMLLLNSLYFVAITLINISILQYQSNFVSAINFNRSVTGVVYSAYVRHVPTPGPIPSPDWAGYSLHDIQVMMQVISARFSMITTFGMGAQSGSYQRNVTFHENAYSQKWSAEAAANINGRNNNLTLSILIGVWISKDPSVMHNEVQLALESAQKANEIYPNTVVGVVFSENNIGTDMSLAKIALTELKKIRQSAQNLKLKIGCRQTCNGITDEISKENRELMLTRRDILKVSDFVICTLDPGNTEERLLSFREDLKQFNQNLKVMGQTVSQALAGNTEEERKALETYWTRIDSWASKHNFVMWMSEAFDNPWKHWDPNGRWWKLGMNDDVGKFEGYIEKVTTSDISKEKSMNTEAGVGPWVYVGIPAGTVLALVVVVQLLVIYFRLKRVQNVLTKEEVNQFLNGAGNDEEASRMVMDGGGENSAVETAALTKGYNKEYEFAEKDVTIYWQNLLGSGEFGCVYKASLSILNERDIVVALKMAKPSCPKNVFKSLLSEIKILIYLGSHPNLVSLKGAYTAEIQKGVCYVATELCELGSLKSFLKDGESIMGQKTNAYANVQQTPVSNSVDTGYLNELSHVTTSDMIRWSYEIASGMEYLESKHVIHADLATRNVLLTGDKVAKITDFGLSRRMYEYTNYVKTNQEPLPWRWMPVEALRKLEFSSKSDVWSFGVTLWEVFSMGDIPYPGMTWTLDFVDVLASGLRMKQPSYASAEIYGIMCACWENDPNARPTFTQLKLHLEELIKANGNTSKIFQA